MKITWGTTTQKTNPFLFWDYLRLNNFTIAEQKLLLSRRKLRLERRRSLNYGR